MTRGEQHDEVSAWTAGLPGGRAAAIGFGAVATVWAASIAYRLGWWRTGPLDLVWNGWAADSAGAAGRAVSTFLAVAGAGWPATALLAFAVGVRRGWYWALVVLVVSSISALQVGAMKAAAGRPRPDAAYGFDNAFPSGHTTGAAVLATLAALLLVQGGGRWLPLLYPLVMGWSRTVLHAHWLTDVAAGALLGISTVVGLGWVARALSNGLRRRPVLDQRR